MNETFVENSKDDIDDQNRPDEEQRQALHGAFERLGRPLKTAADGRGQSIVRHTRHRRYGIAEGNTGLKVEGDRHRRKLPQVIDRQRTLPPAHGRHGFQRNEPRVGRPDVQQGNGCRVALILRLQLHDHPVLVVRRIDCRHLPGSVGGVKRLFDLADAEAQRRGFVTVDIDVYLGVLELEVAGHVLQLGQLAQFRFERRRGAVEFLRVRALERVLIEALGKLAADANGWQVLEKYLNAGNLGQLGTQFLNDLVRAQAPLGTRLQPHENTAGVGRYADS